MYVADGYVVYYYEMCLLWNDCGWVIYNSKNKFIDYCKGFSHLRFVNYHYSWYITVYFDGICVFNVSLILSAHVSFTLENALVTWDVGCERSNSYTDQHHKSKTTLYLLKCPGKKTMTQNASRVQISVIISLIVEAACPQPSWKGIMCLLCILKLVFYLLLYCNDDNPWRFIMSPKNTLKRQCILSVTFTKFSSWFFSLWREDKIDNRNLIP